MVGHLDLTAFLLYFLSVEIELNLDPCHHQTVAGLVFGGWLREALASFGIFWVTPFESWKQTGIAAISDLDVFIWNRI